MKKHAYTIIASMLLTGFVAFSSAKAQSLSSGKLEANIPFEFSVGNKLMPAGEYTVRSITPTVQNVVLLIQCRRNNTSAMIQTTAIESGRIQESAKLVFHRYGDRYFFAQAWITGNSKGLKAPRTRTERALSDEMAGNAPKTETIALTRRR